MTDYKIKPRQWQNRDEAKSALLWISLSKEETKGTKLRSAAQWLDAHFPRGWHIDLADTLDRHNRVVMDKLSPSQAEVAARAAGQEWVAAESKQLEGLRNFKGIIHFDYWRQHKDFNPILQSLRETLKKSRPYRDAVWKDAGEFMKRRFVAGAKDLDKSSLVLSSVDYIVEETAAGILAAREMGAVRFYPGPQLASLKLLREGRIFGAPEGYGNETYVEIVLERRKIAPSQDNSNNDGTGNQESKRPANKNVPSGYNRSNKL